MDFTREPIIETVITPKEGCKLVVRSSKSTAQDEYFVDAVEVVSFGHSFFFRSLERPKPFFVPATDYEILEVRETRMVLKNVGIDRTIKIAGGREAPMRPAREHAVEKEEPAAALAAEAAQGAGEKAPEMRTDKKRERRRKYRTRRGREPVGPAEEKLEGAQAGEEMAEPKPAAEGEAAPLAQQVATTSILTSLLPPPPMLISDTIARYYKDNALYKGAFYSKTEPKVPAPTEEPSAVPLQQPEYGSFEMSEQELEEVYKLRKKQARHPPQPESEGEQKEKKQDEKEKQEEQEGPLD